MSDYDFEESPRSIPAAAPNSQMALISLIAGILGWTILPGIASIVAIVTGHMAKREIRESNGALGGDGLATIGLVLGYLSIGLAVLAICVAVGFFVLIPLFAVASGELSALPMLQLMF